MDVDPAALPPLYRYGQLPHEDVAITMWWGRLEALGERDLTFGAQSASLSRFFALFGRADDPTRGLYYRLDESGRIALAFLVVPTMTSCAMATVWLAPAWRRHARGREALAETYAIILTTFPVLLGVTRQERLVAVHTRWGYRTLGSLPGVFDGHDATLLVLTDDAFRAARAAGFPRRRDAMEDSDGYERRAG